MPPGLKLDLTRRGLGKFLNDYEELALRYIWAVGEYGADSASVWRVVSERLPPGRSISRASIITFLNKMAERGVLSNTEVTGKGGHRKIYRPKQDEKEFIESNMQTIIDSLMSDFPEETNSAIKNTRYE